MILVCIDLNSNTLPAMRESGAFAVNILTSEQEHLSRCFATTSEERYENFCHASFHSAATGSPIIDDVLGFIDAQIVAEYPGGDHVIFLGQVMAMGSDGYTAFASEVEFANAPLFENHYNGLGPDKKEPLTYYRGKYRHLACDYVKPSLAK